MIKEEKIQSVTTIRHRYCDECGKKIIADYGRMSCEICGKDLCGSCIGHEKETLGDYYEVYCKRCWELGEKYRLEIEKHEEEIKKLSNEWISKCIQKNDEKQN